MKEDIQTLKNQVKSLNETVNKLIMYAKSIEKKIEDLNKRNKRSL